MLNVTFSSAPSVQCVPIPLENDRVVEDAEPFVVGLSSADSAIRLLTPSLTVVFILDSTGEQYVLIINCMIIFIISFTGYLASGLCFISVVTIGFEASSYTVAEEDGIATLCVEQTSQVPVNLDIAAFFVLNTNEMTATGKLYNNNYI